MSGGESQRVKLSSELSRIGTGRTIYILDEPTTGLHFEDIKALQKIIYKLRERGNTIVIIEHNIDMIKISDFIIELGPKGGKDGGNVLFQGWFNEFISNNNSLTNEFVKKELNLN